MKIETKALAGSGCGNISDYQDVGGGVGECLLTAALESVCKEKDKHKVFSFQPKAVVENQKASMVPYNFLISCS